MRYVFVATGLVVAGAAIALIATTREEHDGNVSLPLQRLFVYSSGVGYYERGGELPRGGVAELPLEAGQLDDALKTAVVLSEDGVASIEYDPPVPREASLAEAGVDGEDPAESLEEMIATLRGAEVRVERRTGDAIEGRIVGGGGAITAPAADEEGTAAPPARASEGVVVFGPAGLVRVPFAELVAIRPKDPALVHAWDRALRASSKQPVRGSLRVRAGSRGGKVTVGYTTESPVWRTTYRLIVADAGSRVQGFALVHNNTDEAWSDVAVTLVSGKPRSFLFPLAVPRYSRRELVAPNDGLEVAPQLLTADVRGQLLGSELGESIGLGSVGTVGYGAGGGGYGSGSGSIHTVGRSSSDLLIEGPSPIDPAAVSEAGDLFMYTVMHPVTLPARTSALLPIADSRIDAERVSVIDSGDVAQSGVRLANDTKLTLEEGTIAVYADAAFAGETNIVRTKPKEVRVLTHGDDLDLEVSHRESTDHGPALAVRRRGAAAVVESIDRLTHDVDVTSRSDRPRKILVRLGGEGYRIMSGGEEDVRSPGQQRYARLAIAAREKKSFAIVEERASAKGFDVASPAAIDELTSSVRLDEASKAKLARARAAAERVQEARADAQDAEGRLAEVQTDVVRLRESVAAAGRGGASAAIEALASKLVRAEERLEAARKERDEAKKREAAARGEALAALD